jgi:murein DD-endopeptidase MepM/ murein hydrolase activator NlpD
MESSPIKFASGGIVDNPTTGQAVIPKNKLTQAVKTNQDNVKKADPFAKVMQLPTMAAGALLMSTVGNVINNMGGVSKLFRPVLSRMFVPAATAFGLPANLITAFFGSGASAKGLGGIGKGKGKGKGGGSNGGGSETAPGVTPGSTIGGGTISGGGSVDGYGISSPFGPRNTGIPGASTNHLGVDYRTPQGTKLSIKRPGKVIATTAPAIGNNGEVYIQHDDGSKSRYLHLSAVAVSAGQRVDAGAFLGKTGGEPGTPGAGPTSGAHLHFEYYPDGSSGPVDGSGVASSVFSVGGTLTPTAPPTAVQPTAVASPSAQTPQPAAATPESNQPATLEPIVLPAPAAPAPAAAPDNSGNGGANLPVRNPNASMSLLGGMP